MLSSFFVETNEPNETEIHSNFFQLSSRQSLDQNEKVGSQSPAECLGGDDGGRCFREARQGVSFDIIFIVMFFVIIIVMFFIFIVIIFLINITLIQSRENLGEIFPNIR